MEVSMPRPTKDFPLAFRREIQKIDARIAKLADERWRLVQAYEVISGDTETFSRQSEAAVVAPAHEHGQSARRMRKGVAG
jgi:hypothetical protein